MVDFEVFWEVYLVDVWLVYYRPHECDKKTSRLGNLDLPLLDILLSFSSQVICLCKALWSSFANICMSEIDKYIVIDPNKILNNAPTPRHAWNKAQ